MSGPRSTPDTIIDLECTVVPMYLGPMRKKKATRSRTDLAAAPAPVAATITVTRVQTGMRLEKRLLKVLKGFAGYRDISLGDLIEGIVLHAFEGRAPFGEESMRKIRELRSVYGLDLDASASHRLVELDEPAP